MKTSWKPNRAIISDWEEDSGGRSAKLTNIRKWANDETKKLYTVEQLTKQISFINIDNHHGYLPENYHKIIQAAYGDVKRKQHVIEHKAVEWVSKNHYTGCNINVRATCPSCHKPCNPKQCDCSSSVLEYEYTPNLYDKAAHPEWYPKMVGLGMYNIGRVGKEPVHGDCPMFKLMRPRTNSFFNINAHIPGCLNFNVTSKVTYEIHDNYQIEVNEKECKVLISYLGYRIDDDGFYMVPDLPEVWDALKRYIDMKLVYGQWAKTADPKYERQYLTMDGLYEKAHAKAKMKLARVEPERLKAAWDNMVGKQIPHYYAEETYYEYVDDTFRRLR